jgi:hypothetical protein
MAINLSGLLQGFQQGNQFVQQQKQNKRAEEQFKLTERRQRGMELDTKFKEARRVAELDALDDDNTLKQLSVPGMDEASRQAILEARKRRRSENEVYLKSMTADPESAQELTTRFGDVTKLMKPSTIQQGLLPKPTMDIAALIKSAEAYRREAELTPDEESKQFLVTRGRDALTAMGASQDIVNKFLPVYKSVIGKGQEVVSPLALVSEPEALKARGIGAGGSFVDPQTGQTVRISEQDGKLMKSYVTPAKDVVASYLPAGAEGAKVKKIYADIDRTEAAIKDLESKIKMRPEEMRIKTEEALSKITDRKLKAQIAKDSLGIKYAGLALRRDLAMMARDDARRKLGISTSFKMADHMRKIQNTAQSNLSNAEGSLRSAQEKLAKATTTGDSASVKQLRSIVGFLESEVGTLRQAASGRIDYNMFQNSMDNLGLGDVDLDMSMFSNTAPQQYMMPQQAPAQQPIYIPQPYPVQGGYPMQGGYPPPQPYPYPAPAPGPTPVPAPQGGGVGGMYIRAGDKLIQYDPTGRKGMQMTKGGKLGQAATALSQMK